MSGGGSGLGRATALELAALGATRGGLRAAPRAARGDRRRGRGRPLSRRVACDIREEDQVDGARRRGARPPRAHRPARQQRRRPVPDPGRGHHAEGLPHGDAAERRGHLADDPRGRDAGDDSGARGGKIVNVTLSPHHGLPGMAHSSAARAAVENLTRVLSIEWARFGITLTALAAGPLRDRHAHDEVPEAGASRAWRGPCRCSGSATEEEFAWLVAYLASPAGDYFSGAVLTLDGARDNWFGRLAARRPDRRAAASRSRRSARPK